MRSVFLLWALASLPYTFDQNGYYLVSLSSTDSTGYSWTESQLHWVNSTNVPAVGFTVFPNPCESSLWIVVSDPWVGKSYTVMNSMGQHVAHGTVTGNSQSIPAPWASGVYLIEMDGSVRRLVVE